MTRYHIVSLKKKGKVNAINIFNFQRLVRGGLRNTENQRDSHSVRVQSSYKFCRSDGRSRRQIGHSSPGRVANHHLHRLYHFRGLPGSSNFDLSIISRTEGNYYTIPNFAPISNFQSRFPFFQSDRTTIHKNLCVCLLIAEILFVCGIGQTNQRIVCGIVAGLLHFFFLCAFAWMFLEGIYTTPLRKHYPLHPPFIERQMSDSSMEESLILL